MTAANFTVPGSPLPMSALATFINAALAAIGRLQVTATAVNFNSANTDTPITINLPTGYSRYRVTDVVISGASASLTTATCGLFSVTGAGGTAIVTSASAITVSTASANTNNNAQALTVNNSGTAAYNFATLYFRVQTAEGSAATGNVSITYEPLP